MRVRPNPPGSHPVLTVGDVPRDRNARKEPDMRRQFLAILVGVALLVAACGGGGTTASQGPTATSGAGSPPPTRSPPKGGPPTESPVPPEQPVPSESSPPGDIPDNTAFVPYRAPGGFVIRVPEGWARTRSGPDVSFTDKLNTVSAAWAAAPSAPTVASARKSEVPQLRTTERALRLGDVKSVTLPGGSAVLITFQENSAPNTVTGKQYRLDVERFEFYRGGTEAVLTLSSPEGADNVDPWRIVSESFAWR